MGARHPWIAGALAILAAAFACGCTPPTGGGADDDAAGDDSASIVGREIGGVIEPFSPYLRVRGPWLVDERGRVVILRGVQIIATGPPYLSYHTEEDYDRLLEWGFNSVRLGTVWAAIEPAPGEHDEDYLRALDERIAWCRERGIYVILDMHQDLYGEKYAGDGAPVWACLDDGIPYTPVSPWFLNYFQPAVIRAFDNFWLNKVGVQDRFVAMWAHVAGRWVGEPYVAGYDLFNEPFFGSMPPLPLPGHSFDAFRLQPFYENLIARLREADPNHLVFFEPTGAVGAGVPCGLESMGFANTVYAPHLYPPIPNALGIYSDDDRYLRFLLSSFVRKANELGVPAWVGEWALFNAQTRNRDRFMRDATRLMDELMLSWTYWIYNRDDNVGLLDTEGNERAWVLDAVSRVYPQKVCGFPERFLFDPDARRFEMTWIENPDARGPTEIFIPARHFPDGFSVTLSDPGGAWRYEWDDQRRLLLVDADRSAPRHTLVIEPSGVGSK